MVITKVQALAIALGLALVGVAAAARGEVVQRSLSDGVRADAGPAATQPQGPTR